MKSRLTNVTSGNNTTVSHNKNNIE